MRSFPLIVSLPGLLAIAVAAAAPDAPKTGPAGPGTPREQWGKPENGLRLRLSADKDEFRVGDAVVVTFHLKNVSDRVLNVPARAGGSVWCNFEFADEAGKPIPSGVRPPDPAEREHNESLHRLEPGQEMTLSVDMSHWELAGLGHPYTPIGREARPIVLTGIYRTPAGLTYKRDDVWVGIVQAPPLTIRIVPAAPPAAPGTKTE